MARRSDEAYVLGTRLLGEADVIVTLLAEHAGRLRGVAASARRSRRRFGGALEPLTRVRAEWVEREGRDLHRIEGLDLVRSFATMQSEPAVQAACAVLAEICAELSREECPDPAWFRLLGAVLEAFEAGLHPWLAVRYFEYWTLRLHGLLPNASSCATCGADVRDPGGARVDSHGFVRCVACDAGEIAGGVPLSLEDQELLRRAAACAPSALGSDRRAARPGGAVEALLRGSLESFAEHSFRAYAHLARASCTAMGGGLG